MPYDPTPVETQHTIRDGLVGLLDLARELRKPLPIGFKWDFSRCDSCAMGLAAILRKEPVYAPSVVVFQRAAKTFKISFSEAVWLFGYYQQLTQVSPIDVAERLEQFVERKIHDYNI